MLSNDIDISFKNDYIVKMGFRWKSIIELIFQFEITYITILKSKEDIMNLFLEKSNEKWYISFNKNFKIKSSNNILHLTDKIRYGRSINHYYISFTENNKNETIVKIFSRIEYFYIFFEMATIILVTFFFIMSLIEQNIFGIVFTLLLIIFILFFNGIAKMTRKERVKDLLNILKRLKKYKTVNLILIFLFNCINVE